MRYNDAVSRWDRERALRHTHAMIIDCTEVQAFLASHFHRASSDVERIGAGAWSQCFGFRCGDQELVIRFGQHVDDFRKDQRASSYRAPDLLIPAVLAIGAAFDDYYAISTRVHGVALERVGAAQWQSIVPSLAAALEAMRLADVSATMGYGGWGGDGHAPHARWSDHLLSVGNDTPDRRTYGWRARLAAFPEADAVLSWGFERLKQVANDSVPRCLIHGDLINRNVLVSGTRITGVFDWGCACYGDHLYDLAWFAFWAPWFPSLDIDLLRSELVRRWRAVGYVPHQMDERLMACYLHIGLDHLAYNAYLEDIAALAATAERMQTLVSGR
jgi:hygromycin-B 4-O-kinase